MIFIANNLPVNGGSTFLLRICSELNKEGEACVVLLLRRSYDAKVYSELKNKVDVVFLDEFLHDKGLIFQNVLSIFGFIKWKKIISKLLTYGNHVHVMGSLGLYFSHRLSNKHKKFIFTFGIYHQNEYIYKETNYFFPKKINYIFRKVPASNILFFNKGTQKNYSEFFKKNYETSTIAPIGIANRNDFSHYFDSKSQKIVSIGNLIDFKTYNENLIKILPILLNQYPEITYHIYGEGSNAKKLEKLVSSLNLSNNVFFFGKIDYSRFCEPLRGASLFLGSGTALLEAAACGVPALIGIESIEDPVTYGFLSEIQGFDYNENLVSVKKKPLVDILLDYFSNENTRLILSDACLEKSKDFSIDKTLKSLRLMENTNIPLEMYISYTFNYKMLMSFIYISVVDILKIDQSFSKRRNQSFVG